jgi:hypothetical protein
MNLECCDPTAPIEKCMECGNMVYTCEKQEWGKDGLIPYKITNDYRCPVHKGGVQSLLGWFCSEECYFKYDDY